MPFLSRVSGGWEATNIVTFENGLSGRVSPADADTLAALDASRDIKVSVSASIDDGVVRASVPHIGPVTGVEDTREGVRVTFDNAERGVTLLQAHPDFAAMRAAFQDASIDNRLIAAAVSPRDIVESSIPAGAIAGASVVTGGLPAAPHLIAADAAALDAAFAACRHEGCLEDGSSPAGVSPCLLFPFPDKGCNARAHRMAAILRSRGVSCGKAWLFMQTPAVVDVPHRRNCRMTWLTHVAVVARAAQGAVIFDPALFDAPAPLQTWRRLISPTARLLETDARIYALMPHAGQWRVTYDDHNELTRQQLAQTIQTFAQVRRYAPDCCVRI